MRILVPLVMVAFTAACASRAPLQPSASREPSAWSLDRQPVPHTLEEALQALAQGLGDGTIAQLRVDEEDIAIRLVPTLGRWMQDRWGLATGGPLAQYFQQRGLDRPDDMAAVILTSLWRELHFRQIRLEEQIAWYIAMRQRQP
jgi:hypothetical protein